MLFGLELTALTLWLDSADLNGRRGLTAGIRDFGPAILRFIIGFAALFSAIALVRYRIALAAIAEQTRIFPVSIPLLCGHFACLGAFGLLSFRLYSAEHGNTTSDLTAVCWILAGVAAIGFGACAFLRYRFWAQMRESTGPLWIYSLAAGCATFFATEFSRSLWPVATRATFSIVGVLLRLLGPVVADPAHMSIGTRHFTVEIAPECSGLEGVGLMLVFGVAWLTIFRREYRFPQALILLPAGMVFIFLLNSVRIALLILIGNAGAERIATGGFHSQAGWMIFNLAAVGFSLTAGRTKWGGARVTEKRTGRDARRQTSQNNPSRHVALPNRALVTEKAPANLAAVWVLPLVALLAAGMAAHAASGDFEWLYPLRFFAVLGVVWRYRAEYREFDWRVGWQAPAMGVIVFAIWIVLDRTMPLSSDRMPLALAGAASSARIGWIAIRALASSTTVPFAEELAFRGFLLRRLPGPLWLGVLLSSVAFGTLHGDRWIAGTVAGVGYALVYLRKGRVSEAIAAHALTNALIAGDVLAAGVWHLW